MKKSLLTATVGPVANCLIVAVLHPRKADAPAAVARLESVREGRLGIAIGGRAKLVLDLAAQSVKLALRRSCRTGLLACLPRVTNTT